MRFTTRAASTLAIAALMVLAGALVVRQPVVVAVAVGGLAAVAAMMLRIEWAVLVYVAAEPFSGYLTELSSTSIKLVGAVLFAAWLLRLVIKARPVSLRHPALYAAGALFLALLAATAMNPNGSVGLQVASRYLSYLAVLVVLVDSMRTGLPPRRVATVFVTSCSVAAVVGLVSFLDSGGGRAAGPMSDANDFAFYLVCALPFALILYRLPGRYRHLFAVAAGLLVVTTLATFSRGAVLGIIAMLIYAVVAGLVRVRTLIGGALVVGVAVTAVIVLAPGLVQRSFDYKQNVASANVSSRFTSWTMAGEMTADDPLFGKGPGGFRTNFKDYLDQRSTDQTHLDVAHQMYLDVSSELGLVGLAAFAAMLGFGVAGAQRATRRGPSRELAGAVCASFAATLVAASFLSEQFYLPVWLLVAFGAALDPRVAQGPEHPGKAAPDTALATTAGL